MNALLALWRRFACFLSYHPKLDVIQSFGTAQHIGCPYCRREMAIHHGLHVVIPWDQDLALLYQMMGYDVETPTMRWRRVKP